MLKHHDVEGSTMPAEAIRSTLYLEPALHRALRLKAATVHRSMSDIVNDALREALREDHEDLAAFAEREGEPSISYEEFLARLKADGTI
jgi:plasmid stability protein